MNKQVYVFLISLIVFLGFGMRVYKLTTSPAGFYTDESSIGNNAWSIVTTGRDEHNKPWPLAFEAYGEYKLPLYIYAVALFIRLLGPLDVTVRLPAMIFGTATVLFTILFARELIDRTKVDDRLKQTLPLFTGLLTALSPWQFQFTRPGFEASAGLMFLTLGLWLFFMALRNNSKLVLTGSFLSFVATFYSYNSSRVVTPLLLLFLFVLYIRRLPFRAWLVAGVVAALASLPFARFALSSQGMYRARTTLLIYREELKGKWWPLFWENYKKNISPTYLFEQGDPTIAHLTPHRWGLHYRLELPFFFLGIAYIVKKRHRELLIPLWLFLIGLVPPSLAWGSPHALRGLYASVGSIFLSSLGVAWCISLIRKRTLLAAFISGYLLILFVQVYRFLDTYHNRYPLTAIHDWQVDLKLMAQAVTELESAYSRVYFREGIHKTAVIWDLRIPPDVYLAADKKHELGKYVFGVKSFQTVPKTGMSLYVTYDEQVEGGRLVRIVTLPNGKPGHRIWEL